MLTSNSVLTLPKCDDKFVLQTGASGKGISAILSVYRDGQERPVAYNSKKLTPAERHYSATEVEGLAVVRGVQHFGHYLIGRHFRIENDHRALQFLQSACHLNGRLSRWALLLQS